MIELRRPEPLDTTRHDRSVFECGDASLDDWLRRYAAQNRRQDNSATWVITDADGVIVGYVALSMTGIDLSAAPPHLRRGSPDPVPGLLVGRLAVDRRYAGLGIGTALVGHVLATAVELNAKVACKAIVVAALNLQACAWWERFGFARVDPDDSDCLDMYLLTQDVERTLASGPPGAAAE